MSGHRTLRRDLEDVKPTSPVWIKMADNTRAARRWGGSLNVARRYRKVASGRQQQDGCFKNAEVDDTTNVTGADPVSLQLTYEVLTLCAELCVG